MSNVIKIGPTPTVPGFLFGVSGTLSSPVISEIAALPAPKKLKVKPGAPLKPALAAKAAVPGKLIRKKVF